MTPPLHAHAPAAPLWVTVVLLVLLACALAYGDQVHQRNRRTLARSVPHRADGVVTRMGPARAARVLRRRGWRQ